MQVMVLDYFGISSASVPRSSCMLLCTVLSVMVTCDVIAVHLWHARLALSTMYCGCVPASMPMSSRDGCQPRSTDIATCVLFN
jgi:hypothetical protein